MLVGEGRGGYEDAHRRSNRAAMASRRRSTRVLCFWGRNRGAGNWSSKEEERRAAQLGELGGGVELHKGLFIGAERRWRKGGSGDWSAGGLAARLQWRGGGFGRRGAARSGGASGEVAQGDGMARAGAPVSK